MFQIQLSLVFFPLAILLAIINIILSIVNIHVLIPSNGPSYLKQVTTASYALVVRHDQGGGLKVMHCVGPKRLIPP
jgi:hypothetical protein